MNENDKEKARAEVKQACGYLWLSLVCSALSVVNDYYRSDQQPTDAQLISLLIVYIALSAIVINIAAGKNWARYTSLVLTIIGFPFLVLMAIEDLANYINGIRSEYRLLFIAGPASLVLQIMGLWLVFTNPGKSLFNRQVGVARPRNEVPISPDTPTLEEKLTQLRDLRDQGLIDQPDYERKKEQLLAKF